MTQIHASEFNFKNSSKPIRISSTNPFFHTIGKEIKKKLEKERESDEFHHDSPRPNSPLSWSWREIREGVPLETILQVNWLQPCYVLLDICHPYLLAASPTISLVYPGIVDQFTVRDLSALCSFPNAYRRKIVCRANGTWSGYLGGTARPLYQYEGKSRAKPGLYPKDVRKKDPMASSHNLEVLDR